MTFSKKIDEWIQEAETRPGSALMILKLIAGRLRDLTERNEELLAENIALQDGSRVEEYQKRIAHLEFQLDLLKRRLGSPEVGQEESRVETGLTSLLVYNALGHMLRLELPAGEIYGVINLGKLSAELLQAGESPRLLSLRNSEEVLLLFSSGRVSRKTVIEIPALPVGGSWSWEQAALLDEPHAGELLTGLLPLAQLPVSEYFLQVSRRGFIKKTMSSLAEKILSSHYLGRGTIQKSDQPLDVCLVNKKNTFVVVSHEGHLLGLEVENLSYASEERIRLNPLDYIVAGFLVGEGESLLCLTRNGKVIQREAKSLEIAKTGMGRGQALIPAGRLEQGTRFIGALAFEAEDSIAILDAGGNLSLQPVAQVVAAGIVQETADCLAIARVAVGSKGVGA